MDDWELEPPEQKPGPPAGSGPPAGPGLPAPAPTALAVQEGTTETLRSGRLRGVHVAVPVAAALVILLAGMMIGFFIARGQTSGDAALLTEARDELSQSQQALSVAEERNWAYYRANEALKKQLEEAMTGGSASTTLPGPVQPAGAYGDGVYLVGEDIAPGTYDGVVDGDFGYWARLKSTDGSTSGIIANGIVRGPFVLEIYIGDRAVELRGVTITAR